MPEFPPARERAIVVGSGIAGMAAAFRLRQAGFAVTVLEEQDYLGGKMSTLRRDGWMVNRAANMLPGSYSAITGLVRDVGVSDAVGAMPARIGVLRDGRVHTLRGNGAGAAIDGLRTPLLSARGKLLMRRLAADALRMRSSLSYTNLGDARRFDTETAAAYCDRRLSPELRDYLVEPVVRALFTTGADRVSVVDFFFAVVNFLGSGLIRFTGGIDFLVRGIAAHVDVRLGAPVTSVRRDARSATVSWSQDGIAHEETVAGVVLAVGGSRVPGLYPQLAPVQRAVLADKLQYATTFVAHLGLSRRPDVDAMVVTVPRTEDANLCVVDMDHLLNPDSMPAGKGLISSFWLHDWNLAHAHLDDGALVERMVPALEKIVPGLGGQIEFVHVDRWSPSVVRSYPGVYTEVAAFVDAIDPAERVQLAGDYLTASSTNGSAVSGERAAARLRQAVFGSTGAEVRA